MTNNEYGKYSPEEIFEIFKEQHRLASPLDPIANEKFIITKETLIIDLQDAQDLLPWEGWTEWLNTCYQINADRSEWKKIVTPTVDRTIWDVCVFISEKANKEIVKPVKLFGQECLTAAIFLTLKRNLEHKGANTEDLMPSTVISEFLDDDKNFSPLLEEATLTGVKTFDQVSFGELRTERRFEYWIDKILPNIIFKRPIKTGNIITFRDLVERIVENEKLGIT